MKKAFLSGPIRSAGAFVGVALPAKPFTFIGPRQPGPDFPGPSAPLLASPSLQSLLPSSGHANLVRIFPVRRRLCWRRPPCKAFYIRRATPTWPGFSRPAGASVGVALPAKPFTSVGPRQPGPAEPSVPRASLLF